MSDLLWKNYKIICHSSKVGKSRHSYHINQSIIQCELIVDNFAISLSIDDSPIREKLIIYAYRNFRTICHDQKSSCMLSRGPTFTNFKFDISLSIMSLILLKT